MEMVLLDSDEQRRILRERREARVDRFDEVWDGAYVVSPVLDNEHQALAFHLASALGEAVRDREGAHVYNGVYISDREAGWKRNWRRPDVAVFLPGCPARDCRTHWFGGPDFAAEVLSRGDRSRRKMGFYAGVGVRELLLADRRPWCLELYRRGDDGWDLIDKSSPGDPVGLASAVLPVTFHLRPGEARPLIEVTHADGERRWLA